jgi:hypothetical protein
VWRTGREGYYAVDVGNVEIRTKGAKFSRVQNSDRLDVTGPIVREENAKTARYEQLCNEQRMRTFIPVIMSSFYCTGSRNSEACGDSCGELAANHWYSIRSMQKEGVETHLN